MGEQKFAMKPLAKASVLPFAWSLDSAATSAVAQTRRLATKSSGAASLN